MANDTVPTAETFKARHVKFASVSDATVDLYLAEAARTVSDDWNDDDYEDAIMYLAAHLMVEEGALNPTGGAPSTTGPVKKLKAGSVEAEFDVSREGLKGSLGAQYGSTIYGRRFYEIARRNGYGAGGILVV